MPNAPLAGASLAGVVVALDLDGTLVDTAPDLIGVLNQILAEHNHHALPLEAARTVVGHGARAMLERGFAAAGVTLATARMDALWSHFIDLYVARIAVASRPFPGVLDALDALSSAGARLVVCTNKRTDLSLALLDALGMTSRFTAILGPDLSGAYKPDPRHLLAAIDAAGGQPGRSIMVGDATPDILAARAAGVPSVAVSFGYCDVPLAELGADILIDHFDELPHAVLRLLSPPTAAMSPGLPADA